MQVTGGNTDAALNAESTILEKLKLLFESFGLTEVVTQPIDIQISYADFDDYWNANTGFLSPVATAVKALDEDKRQQIKRIVRANLPSDDRGGVSYAARVNAVRGSV